MEKLEIQDFFVIGVDLLEVVVEKVQQAVDLHNNDNPHIKFEIGYSRDAKTKMFSGINIEPVGLMDIALLLDNELEDAFATDTMSAYSIQLDIKALINLSVDDIVRKIKLVEYRYPSSIFHVWGNMRTIAVATISIDEEIITITNVKEVYRFDSGNEYQIVCMPEADIVKFLKKHDYTIAGCTYSVENDSLTLVDGDQKHYFLDLKDILSFEEFDGEENMWVESTPLFDEEGRLNFTGWCLTDCGFEI